MTRRVLRWEDYLGLFKWAKHRKAEEEDPKTEAKKREVCSAIRRTTAAHRGARSQGEQAASGVWRRRAKCSPLEPPGGTQPCTHPDFRIPGLQNCR